MGAIDITLRHISHQHASALTRTLPTSVEVSAVGAWRESQLTTRERRLDKALEIFIDGQRCFLHVEFQAEPDGHMGWRVFEYAAMLAQALRSEGHDGPIVSQVVLLSGPPRVARQASFELGLRGALFFGVDYLVEPVYLRTLAELEALGPFWQAFAPLARDVTARGLEEMLRRLQSASHTLGREALADLGAAMRLMAEFDPRAQGLESVVTRVLGEEFIMQGKLTDMIDGAIERSRSEGELETFKRMTRRIYLARFAAMPEHVASALGRVESTAMLEQLCALIATARQDEIDALISRAAG